MINFGTGGWRAIIGDGFTKQNIQLLARAMAYIFEQENIKEPLVIGYDRRFLSKEAVYWFAEVFCHYGNKLLFVKRSVPTPVVMYYTMAHDLPYGMMVTSSHNPALYNGFKLFTRGGRDADLETTQKLEKIIAQFEGSIIEYSPYDSLKQNGKVQEFYPMNEYLDKVISQIDMEAIKNASLRIVVDPMFGVSGEALKILLITARCYIEVINQQHDTLFGGRMPTPSEERLSLLKNQVKEWQFDIGVATDGDGDRLGILDDLGNYLSANEILSLAYYYFLEYKGLRGDIAINLATSHMLKRIAKHYNCNCHEVKVGFKHISQAMQEHNCILGGESSGGLALLDHIKGKDGVFAAMLVVEMLAVSGKKLSELMKELNQKFGKLYMIEADFRFREDEIVQLRETIAKQSLPNFGKAISSKRDDDGVKLCFDDDSFVICRFSGTEPVLRIFAEAISKEEAQRLVDIWAESLKLK